MGDSARVAQVWQPMCDKALRKRGRRLRIDANVTDPPLRFSLFATVFAVWRMRCRFFASHAYLDIENSSGEAPFGAGRIGSKSFFSCSML